MFDSARNTVHKGSIGLSAAIFHYSKLGYGICIPIVDNQDYDLVIESNGVFNTVQVKTTNVRNNSGFKVELRKIRPNRTGNRILGMGKFDILFVACGDGTCYSIPSDKIITKSQLCCFQFEDFKLHG
jgi:hypothetical protein